LIENELKNDTKYTCVSENSLTGLSFEIPTRYKPVRRSIPFMWSRSEHNLFWKWVHTTCRTLLCTCCRYRAGVLFDHLYR